jgi:glycosyltransferase involved in cell wall biosynthesis
LEAFSCGIPVIGTNVGGIPDLVINGHTGILVPPENSQAIAEGVNSLIENPAKLAEMAKECREYFLKGFTIEQEVAKIENLYESLYKQKSV